MKRGTNIEKWKRCKYAMILEIENEKRHKYRKMQGIQLCDDTGNTKSEEAQISKNARDANMRWYWGGRQTVGGD